MLCLMLTTSPDCGHHRGTVKAQPHSPPKRPLTAHPLHPFEQNTGRTIEASWPTCSSSSCACLRASRSCTCWPREAASRPLDALRASCRRASSAAAAASASRVYLQLIGTQQPIPAVAATHADSALISVAAMQAPCIPGALRVLQPFVLSLKLGLIKKTNGVVFYFSHVMPDSSWLKKQRVCLGRLAGNDSRCRRDHATMVVDGTGTTQGLGSCCCSHLSTIAGSIQRLASGRTDASRSCAACQALSFSTCNPAEQSPNT